MAETTNIVGSSYDQKPYRRSMMQTWGCALLKAGMLEARAYRQNETFAAALCGHGNFDLAAYDAYLAGTLEDPEFSQEDLDAALAALPEGAPSVA